MEELGILKIASLLVGLIAITLMIIRFFLVYTKRMSYKTGMKVLEIIIGICLVKVVLSIVALSFFGIICWIFNTFIWIMISEMEKNTEENRERVKRGERMVFLGFKDVINNIGKSFKSKK